MRTSSASFGRRQKDKMKGSTPRGAVSARFQRFPALPLPGGLPPLLGGSGGAVASPGEGAQKSR
eukprot:9089371-Alexandrium_andersonii.AAC.1